MPNCSSCGLTLSQGATICPACGSWGAGGPAPAADPTHARRPASVPRIARPARRGAAEPRAVHVARPASPAVRRSALPGPSAGLERPPWSVAQVAATAVILEALPAEPLTVAGPLAPAAPAEEPATRWAAVASDAAPPPWSAEAASEPARRLGAVRSSWVHGPGLARAVLIGLVCLAAALGMARGLTLGRTVHLTVGGARPALSEYRQLRAGLSYEQVDAIFNGGLGLGQSSADAHVRRIYGNGARLDLRFGGGVLQSFSEHGLSEGPSVRVYATTGLGAVLLSLAGGLANAVAWWLLLVLVASWRRYRLTRGRLAVLAAAGLAVAIAAALLLPALLGYAIGFVVLLGLLIAWNRRDVAEALIVAAVAIAGGSLAVWLPTMLGLQLALLIAR